MVGGIGQNWSTPKMGPEPVSVSSPNGEVFCLPAEGVRQTNDPSLLARVRRGEFQLDTYLDVSVGDAVRHVQDKLSTAQLDIVKTELRDQLTTNPALIELVRQATGHSIIEADDIPPADGEPHEGFQ
jgi:hypothetical protein